MAKKPVVDAEKCIGCGVCVSLAPGAFEMGPDGKSHVKNPVEASDEEIQSAADSCPAQAITVEEG